MNDNAATDSIREFVLRSIQKRSKLPRDCDLDSFDYVASGHVDSIGIIKFIAEIEARFDIEIIESDIESPQFRTIAGIVSIIGQKVSLPR